MNSPRSSHNIRPSPVFIQPATRSFLRGTQEEMKRVNSPFKMLYSVMGGTEPPVNGTSILGFQKHICLPSPCTVCGLSYCLLWKKRKEPDLIVTPCSKISAFRCVYTLQSVKKVFSLQRKTSLRQFTAFETSFLGDFRDNVMA